MNKKFTFMVAALLAAGGFSANAQDPASLSTVKITNAADKYYHIVIDGTDTPDGFKTNDYFLGMDVSSQSTEKGDITYLASQTDAKGDAYMWKIEVKSSNGKKTVTLKNKATGYALALNGSALVENISEYITESKTLDTVIDVVTIEGKDYLNFDDTKSLCLYVDDDDLKVGGSYDAVALVEIVSDFATSEDVKDLANLGEGFDFTFEGTPTGADVFQGVTIVPTGVNSTSFYIVKGKPAYKADGTLDKANTTFVVLSSTSGITGVDAPNGCKYTTVKGDKFGKALKEGGYPEDNAKFSAKLNINEEGKYALYQPNVYVVENNEWKDSESSVFVSATGNTGAALVNAQESEDNAAWLTPSLGTAVDVKSLVKGQWIVNIYASENKDNTVMKRVVYSSQVASGSKATISSSTENTNKHKDEVYAQWIVSADENANTVTFKNRETGEEIAGVTLFKTPKANVYTTTSTGDEVVTDASGNAEYDLNKCFIELRTVENTTQFDGYLNLDKDGLDTEYTLSVEADDKFADYEVPVIAKNIDLDNVANSGNEYSVLAVADNKDEENVFTFKLAQTKDADSKLDTIFVKEVEYGYYKDGKYTTAKDTLKAISYSFAGLKNAGKYARDTSKDNNGVNASFYMGNDLKENTGKFVLRQIGDKYQILEAQKDVYGSGFVYLYSDGANSRFTTDASTGVATAQSFTLNPVAVAPSYDVPESHIALQINGAYLGSKADGNAIMTNDTSMLKSTVADAAFSFWAFSADKEEVKTPSYYLSSNGKMMYSTQGEYEALNKKYNSLSPVFDEEERAEIKAKMDALVSNGSYLVKFQQAKYVDAENIALAEDTVKGDALAPYKFNVLDVDGQAVLKNAKSSYVQVLNDVVVFTSNLDNAAKFDVVAAEAPTSNESVSASEVKVVANNGSVVVKNAAGKNVVVSTILGQVVANEVLTSDNATINVPAGIVVVAVEGESFKVNVK